jgi:hypothetical protein
VKLSPRGEDPLFTPLFFLTIPRECSSVGVNEGVIIPTT